MSDNRATVRYSRLSIFFHWFTLVMMVAIYATIELHEVIPRGNPLRSAMENWHIYLGFLLLPLAIVRLQINRRKTSPPINPAPSAWQMTLTRWMKAYLYLLMIGMPLCGWIFLSADGAMINVGAFPIPAIAPQSQGLAELAERIHILLGLSGYVFITLHATAALLHHYLFRDDTLVRMLPGFLASRR